MKTVRFTENGHRHIVVKHQTDRTLCGYSLDRGINMWPGGVATCLNCLDGARDLAEWYNKVGKLEAKEFGRN